MSQMEMFPEVAETEKTILDLRAYWGDWDRNKKYYPLPKNEDTRKREEARKREAARKSELLAKWREQAKNFTYANV